MTLKTFMDLIIYKHEKNTNLGSKITYIQKNYTEWDERREVSNIP